MNSVATWEGDDLLLTVGKSVITLSSVASLSAVNIVDSEGKAIKFKAKFEVKGTDGDDYLSNEKDDGIINAGKGNDYIVNYGSKVTISSGNGNDSVSNGGSKVTISSGKGNDSVSNSGENVLFKYGGGNDYISGFNSSSTLQISSGTFDSVVTTNGTDYFVSVDKNTITLEGAAQLNGVKIVNSKGKGLNFSLKMIDNFFNNEDDNTVEGTATIDKLQNSGNKVTVLGYAGDDIIGNTGNNVSIDGGAGKDSISNDGSQVTINGGAGNDTVYSYGSQVSINGGAGDDYIYLDYYSTDKVTLRGGDGKDTFIYNGGTDTILDYTSGDMLKILTTDGKAGGSFTKSSFSDSILTLTISGGGKVIFENVYSGDSIAFE